MGKIVSVGILFFLCVGSFVLAGVAVALTYVLSGLPRIWHNNDFLYGVAKTALTAERHIVMYNFAYNLGRLTRRHRLANREQSAISFAEGNRGDPAQRELV